MLDPIVKRVAGYLGVSMTKKLFAGGIAKAIPVLGAVFSGGLTLGTSLPMSKRLQRHLASLQLTKPDHHSVASDADVIDLEVSYQEDQPTATENAGAQES